jgi:hypothetical protein
LPLFSSSFPPGLAHLDDDLAEGSLGQVFVGRDRLVERINLVDHRPDSALFQRDAHLLKRPLVAYRYALNLGLPEDDWHQVQRRRLTGQKTDDRDVTADPRSLHRVVDAVAADHFQELIDAEAVRGMCVISPRSGLPALPDSALALYSRKSPFESLVRSLSTFAEYVRRERDCRVAEGTIFEDEAEWTYSEETQVPPTDKRELNGGFCTIACRCDHLSIAPWNNRLWVKEIRDEKTVQRCLVN